MNEFERIARFFRPLTQNEPAALNLEDDAALLDVPEGKQLVLTKDAVSAGIHFFPDDDPARIARKLLRVNLSDLAAKGAQPLGYLLAVMLPSSTADDWLEAFCDGLAQDQKEYGLHLLGGDSTAIDGPVSFSLTALGTVPKGEALLRSGARPGDHVYVSGTLGDSALGLKIMKKEIEIPSLRGGRADESIQSNRSQSKQFWIASLPPGARNDETLDCQSADWLMDRYRLPQPRLTLGKALRGIASACIDISDGLAADLGHLCEASQVGAEIDSALLPLSGPTQTLLKQEPALLTAVLTGGDDYELCFTVPPEKEAFVQNLPTPVTKIGRITGTEKCIFLDAEGKPLALGRKGYRHATSGSGSS